MTTRTAVNGHDHSTAVKAAEIEVAAVAARVAAAEQTASDARTFADQLLARLGTGDEDITAAELADAEASAHRAAAIAAGARDLPGAAGDALRAAQLAEVVAEARERAATAPGARAAIKAARAAAVAAAAAAEMQATTYANDAREMGRRLRAAGAPLIPSSDAGPGVGWAGRPDPFGAVIGFACDGQLIT